MQATYSMISRPLLPPKPFLPFRLGRHQKVQLRRGWVSAKGRDAYDWDFSGRLVDESMIVLRKRIHEMKMVERNYEPPTNWMEWEKQCYTSYDSNVCFVVGLLQSQLMNMRPSLALGMVAIVGLSVPASTFFIIFHLIAMVNGIFSGVGLH